MLTANMSKFTVPGTCIFCYLLLYQCFNLVIAVQVSSEFHSLFMDEMKFDLLCSMVECPQWIFDQDGLNLILYKYNQFFNVEVLIMCLHHVCVIQRDLSLVKIFPPS